MGNKSFEEKKKKLRTSSLHYRLNIMNKNEWSQNQIIENQKIMINWFLQTFPLPEEYRESSNWNTKVVANTSFSPLDINSGDMAEGNKPLELHINNEVFQVKSWQDVFIKFLKYVKEIPDLDFHLISHNQNELFKREDVIINWEQLKPLISENSEISRRYKTFERKFWDKVKNLNNETVFIHVNMSASSCMQRLVSIMETLNMNKNEVKIVLR